MAIDRRDLPASCSVAGSAEDAMERLGLAGEGASDRIEGVDLVVADLKLPRLSGLELLERLRASERHAITPCIVLSTSGQESEAARAYALGATGFAASGLRRVREPRRVDRDLLCASDADSLHESNGA
ncbi:MAG: response regulator [Myxococcota bacterium]